MNMLRKSFGNNLGKSFGFMILMVSISGQLVCWERCTKRGKKNRINQQIAEFNDLMLENPVETGDDGAIKRTLQENTELADRLRSVTDALEEDGFSVSSPLIEKQYDELSEKQGTAASVAREFEKQVDSLRDQLKEKKEEVKSMRQSIALADKATQDERNLFAQEMQSALAEKEKSLTEAKKEINGLKEELQKVLEKEELEKKEELEEEEFSEEGPEHEEEESEKENELRKEEVLEEGFEQEEEAQGQEIEKDSEVGQPELEKEKELEKERELEKEDGLMEENRAEENMLEEDSRQEEQA